MVFTQLLVVWLKNVNDFTLLGEYSLTLQIFLKGPSDNVPCALTIFCTFERQNASARRDSPNAELWVK